MYIVWTISYPHHISLLSTAYDPRYIPSYTVGDMLWVTLCIVWTRSYPHHISLLSTAYDPRYIYTCVTHSIYCVVHSIYPQHMFPTVYTLSSTVYSHSICIPRYIAVMSTVYHPHYMYPQYITRYPQYMCCPHHMHMVWVTLTLFSTAYVPQHKMSSTAYTHSICTPYILWVYAVDTTCICCGSHMVWVHMSCADVTWISCG